MQEQKVDERREFRKDILRESSSIELLIGAQTLFQSSSLHPSSTQDCRLRMCSTRKSPRQMVGKASRGLVETE